MSTSFGPQFATPEKFIRLGFHKVHAGLKLPLFSKGALYTAFETAHRSGAARAERDAVAKFLTGRRWAWPWLERCAAEFHTVGIWPLRWAADQIASPLNWESIPDPVRFELLGGEFAAAAYSARDFDQVNESMQLIGGKLSLIPSDERCPAELLWIKRCQPRIDAGDFSDLPPLFPGDGSRLLWTPPARKRRS